MQLDWRAHSPDVHADATVYADSSIIGKVTIGAGSRVMPGARIIAENGGKIVIGCDVIILENAVVRATAEHPCHIGNSVMIGPNSHVVGATIEDDVFIATGASLFHGCTVEAGCEVRINAVVHIRTRLIKGMMVPIGWVAVGDPVTILPPDRHDEIWELQKTLNFPEFVYGVSRNETNMMSKIMQKMSLNLR